ncbi:MAG: 50S ribosomal protein L31 [Thermomicrobiales bacterium]|nr:50S ribosomal protein L31 [Thermomicrobiales bacterium]
MKSGIHPKYQETTVTCACGNTFTTRSTKQNLRTDLCNVCHPFYTGEQRIVDTAGQVERFMKRMENAAAAGVRPSKRQQRLATRAAERETTRRPAEGSESDAAETSTEVATASAEA